MTTNNTIRMALIFGGRSAEHEISVVSARSMSEAIDNGKFEIVPIYITPTGQWHLWQDFNEPDAIPPTGDSTLLLPIADPNIDGFIRKAVDNSSIDVDVVFPLLHGPYGEDGRIQGLLDIVGVPYIGSGVVGSALAMDKTLSKAILIAEGIDTPDFLAVDRVAFASGENGFLNKIESTLGFPIFVKPANMGSSIGINKAKDRKSLIAALADAFKYDSKAICEEAIIGRELECSVLGNLTPEAGEVGEILPEAEFYDYDAKYVTDNTDLKIPADIPTAIREKIRQIAIRTFLVHECRGLARIDFFYVEEKGRVLVNELNTMPGFTPISMYPKLWEAVGLSYPKLVERLVELAFEQAESVAGNKVYYEEAIDV